MRIVPDEVYSLIESEVSSFKNFTSGYIMDNYPLGVSDIIVRFRGKDTQVIKNNELFEKKPIVNVRTRLLASYLEDASKKYPDLIKDLDLIVPICLSDTSDTPLQEIPCLVFSKTAFSNNIVIPSPNNLVGHWEVDTVRSFDKPLQSKKDMMCFVGSFTGNLEDLANNMRLKIAAKASANQLDYFCKLIRPPKMDEEYFLPVLEKAMQMYPDLSQDVLVGHDTKLPIQEQLPYKYQICVDGHTCAWARLPWQMSANCVPMKIRNPKNNYREWFYPLLKPDKHFLELDIDQLDMAYDYLRQNPQAQNDINESGKEFVGKYCGNDLALDVFTQTLLLLNQLQDNTFHVKAEQQQDGTADIRRV